VGQILVTHDETSNSLSKVQIERAQISVWWLCVTCRGQVPHPAHIVFGSFSLQWILSICFSSSFLKWKGHFHKTGYIFLTKQNFFVNIFVDGHFWSNPSLWRVGLTVALHYKEEACPSTLSQTPYNSNCIPRLHMHISQMFRLLTLLMPSFSPHETRNLGHAYERVFFFFSLVFLGCVAMVACPPGCPPLTSVVTAQIFGGFPSEDWL
jgi:hypothetical protein